MPRPFHIEIVDLSRLGPASVAVGRSFQRRWQLAAQGGRGSFFGSGHRVRLRRFPGDEAATVAAAGPMAQQEGRGLTRRKADWHDVNLPDAIPVAFGTGGRVGNASGAASSRRASRWQPAR